MSWRMKPGGTANTTSLAHPTWQAQSLSTEVRRLSAQARRPRARTPYAVSTDLTEDDVRSCPADGLEALVSELRGGGSGSSRLLAIALSRQGASPREAVVLAS